MTHSANQQPQPSQALFDQYTEQLALHERLAQERAEANQKLLLEQIQAMALRIDGLNEQVIDIVNRQPQAGFEINDPSPTAEEIDQTLVSLQQTQMVFSPAIIEEAHEPAPSYNQPAAFRDSPVSQPTWAQTTSKLRSQVLTEIRILREENEQILKTIAAEESPTKLNVDAPLDEQIKYLREDNDRL